MSSLTLDYSVEVISSTILSWQCEQKVHCSERLGAHVSSGTGSGGEEEDEDNVETNSDCNSKVQDVLP